MHINSRWLEKKHIRQMAALNETGWNKYSIHDRGAVKTRLAVQHKAKQDVAAKLGHPVPDDRDLAWALVLHDVRRQRFIGATNKYVPHQGRQECARRVARGL